VRTLVDEHVFHNALHNYLACKNVDMHHKSHDREQSVLGLLLLFDFVFDMLRESGLSVQYSVYNAVRNKQEPGFEVAEDWYQCVFSRLPSLRCLRVDAHTTVHTHYSKWLQCLWLATHIHEVELQRRGARVRADVPREHAELYRKALLFVLEHLQQLYAQIVRISN
jgi:hypothetical protein